MGVSDTETIAISDRAAWQLPISPLPVRRSNAIGATCFLLMTNQAWFSQFGIIRIAARVTELFDQRLLDFEADRLPAEPEAAVARILRFDLAPEELIVRQQVGVAILDGKEIIVRHNADGTETPYYRDHPDGDPRDNLLSLPHYIPPYEPPP